MTDLGITISRTLALLADEEPEQARELICARAQAMGGGLPYLWRWCPRAGMRRAIVERYGDLGAVIAIQRSATVRAFAL